MKSLIKILFMFVSYLTNVNAFGIDLMCLPQLCPETAVSLVKASTAILPQFDSIGHHVLHTNEVLINRVLESSLNPVFKKRIILEIIDLARQGDEMGGKILENYYNFIDYLL